MTDNEIIKALECRKEDMICAVVDEDNRTHFVTNENVLDLINRQKAEIERLERQSNRLGAVIDSLRENICSLSEGLETARAEAIKEFVERLKKLARPFPFFIIEAVCGVTVTDIDNLVKEMVGDDK